MPIILIYLCNENYLVICLNTIIVFILKNNKNCKFRIKILNLYLLI